MDLDSLQRELASQRSRDEDADQYSEYADYDEDDWDSDEWDEDDSDER